MGTKWYVCVMFLCSYLYIVYLSWLVVCIIDEHGIMVSLFVYTDIGPRPLPGHQRRVVSIAPAAVPTGSSHRRRWEMDGVLLYLERLATGVSDDGWQHLSSDMIATIHILPSKLTGVMRKMAMACEHFR